LEELNLLTKALCVEDYIEQSKISSKNIPIKYNGLSYSPMIAFIELRIIRNFVSEFS